MKLQKLSAKVEEPFSYLTSYPKLTWDMSKAFDTVKREIIINLLYDAGCSDEDVKLVQYLLSNTKLEYV